MKNLYNLTINNKTKAGFTIVEVTLAMAFIGALLLAIAMILTNILSLYQKGLVIKSVNSVGRGLVSELTTGINAAPSIDSTSLCNTLASNPAECLKNGAFQFIFQSHEGIAEHAASSDEYQDRDQPVQYYGVLCTGNYTYMWNTWRAFDTGHKLKLTYLDASSNKEEPLEDFKMIRFKDRNYRACSAIAEEPSDFDNYGKVDITELPNHAAYFIEKPEDGFLDSTDVDLYLYELTIFPVSQDIVTLRAIFSGTFILATNRGDVNILRSGEYCNTNNPLGTGTVLDLGSEFNYCAINKFNFAARTAGNAI